VIGILAAMAGVIAGHIAWSRGEFVYRRHAIIGLVLSYSYFGLIAGGLLAWFIFNSVQSWASPPDTTDCRLRGGNWTGTPLSPLREALMFGSGVVVCVVLAYRTQWNTRGDPLVSWDYLPRYPPPLWLRRWFVKVSSGVIVAGVCICLWATFMMR
jgi:hypothetical protein